MWKYIYHAHGLTKLLVSMDGYWYIAGIYVPFLYITDQLKFDIHMVMLDQLHLYGCMSDIKGDLLQPELEFRE